MRPKIGRIDRTKFRPAFIRSDFLRVPRQGRGISGAPRASPEEIDAHVASDLTRRAALAAVSALALAPGSLGAALARREPVGSIRVDVTPVLENSGEPTAGWVAQTLPGAIAEALATVGRGGAAVSVRIDYVLLGPNQGGVGPAGSSEDQMVGAVTSGGVERPLRALTFYYPSAVDNTMIAQSNYNRVFQLAQAFAYWVAREP